MSTKSISLFKEYSFEKIKSHLDEKSQNQLLLIVDVNIWELYKEKLGLKEFIKNENIILWKSPAGEKTKNYKEFESCIEFFLSKGVHRKAHLVAIGGGATSDFAGLVASTLLRGLSWSIIPTTLLSMVDAAIGGKTAINSKHGKNLIGTFHLPDEVWFNPDFLETLPDVEKRSGLGEVLKYGLLSKNIYQLIKEKKPLQEITMACAQYKQEIVEQDFKEEKGARVQLNLGHTLGHAFERVYDLTHGEAVVWGMMALFKTLKEEKSLKTVEQLQELLGLEMDKAPWFGKTIPVKEVKDYLEKDKKSKGNGIVEIVLSPKVGEFKTMQISVSELIEKIKDQSHELQQYRV